MSNEKSKMKNLVYFGSPEFSAEILESLILANEVCVVGIITTPDKPQGRKQLLTPSPLALLGEKYDLPVYKPQKLDEANLAHLKLLKPDIFLVVSYGKIIPQSWLDTPNIGTFNIHFSLLPKYRGALCISEAIKNQDPETGVTLMVMDGELDHGPIVAQQKVTIETQDDTARLTTKLTQAAVKILIDKLPEICAQNYLSTPQDESRVVFTPSHKTLTHASAFILWPEISECLNPNNKSKMPNVKCKMLHALIRSLNPEPGAWTLIDSTEIKILETALEQGKLVMKTVQLPGKQPISWKQFLSGHSLK